MKPGQESQTAVMVCMARAIGHNAPWAASFADPTALPLLPDDARVRVEAIRAGTPPRSVRERLRRRMASGRARMMVARTVAIDDAVRDAASPQLVILGAGLDGRAWRMPELRNTTVFEVDHPDSQRGKRARAGSLAPVARDIRFVPVDFERDRLADALATAGHDPAIATTWIWEGVVMYLAPADIEATLAAIAQRSAAGSRLVIAYHSPALMLRVFGVLVRRLGEPLRSAFTAAEMRKLLAAHGFAAVHDDDLPTIGDALSPDIARATRYMKHMRIVTADRRLRAA